MPNSYLDRLPEHLKRPGNHRHGEIELLTPEPDEKEFGILYEDRYILLLRDKVRFPNGQTGGYLRLLNQSDLVGGSGTVVIPMFENKIFFIRSFRHATRTWEWELPRGFQEAGISEEQNAAKELKEELGGTLKRLERLGGIQPNSGLLAGEIGVYRAHFTQDTPDSSSPEQTESIQGWQAVEESRLNQFLLEKKVTCGITLAALMLHLSDKIEK